MDGAGSDDDEETAARSCVLDNGNGLVTGRDDCVFGFWRLVRDK